MVSLTQKQQRQVGFVKTDPFRLSVSGPALVYMASEIKARHLISVLNFFILTLLWSKTWG